MKVHYNVEIQMLGENERTEDLDRRIGEALGFEERDIDEREIYRLTALFSSEISPEAMQYRVVELIHDVGTIFYADVIFWSDRGQIPQRFTVRNDGKVQNYRTRIVYEEVE